MKTFEKVGVFLGIGLLAVILLQHVRALNVGSLHNSDDSLYAQVIREVFEGKMYPLRFSGQVFDSKPPLAFWTSALFLRTFGAQEASYRLLSLLCLMILVTGAGIYLARSTNRSAGLIASLALLGSPLLSTFGRRVMLDLPLACMGLCALGFAASRVRQRWIVAGLLIAMGFWTKTLAIAPFAAAIWIGTTIWEPENLKQKGFWVGTAIAVLGSAGLWFLRVPAANPGQVVGAVIQGTSLTQPTTPVIYFDLLMADTPLLWMGILIAVVVLFRPRSYPLWSRYLALGSALYVFAILFTRTYLPHYALPVLALLLPLISLLARTSGPWVRTVLLAGIGVQCIVANLYLFHPSNSELDPAHSTKALSQAAASLVPEDNPVCITDVNFSGFRFYSQRPVHGIFLSERAYQAHAAVTEYRPFVSMASLDTFEDQLRRVCGGFTIAPAMLHGMLPTLEVRKADGPLALFSVK